MVLYYENPELTYIGSNPEDYKSAIIGLTHDSEHVVYSYTKLIECYMEEGMSEIEAYEWFDRNTAQNLPYWQNPPIILNDMFMDDEIEITPKEDK